MDDLKPEERDALIRALENGGDIGECLAPVPVWAASRTESPYGDFWHLNTPGTLLAKSLKRERRLERAYTMAESFIAGSTDRLDDFRAVLARNGYDGIWEPER